MFLLQRTWTEMELLPLVCFCLLTCSGTTFGDDVTKMRVKEDEDVILPCSLDSTNILPDTFDWKKDDQKNVFMYSAGSHYNNGRSGQDPQFKGRVFHFEDHLQSGNASIVIRNTKVTDSGNYSCIFPFHQPTTRSIIELIVVTKMRVKEDEDVILSCSLDSTDITSETFDWKKDDQKNVFMYSAGSHYNNGRSGQDPLFKGRVFHFEDQLQSGNASIVIRNTTVTDSGNYSCIFPYHQPTTRSTIELIVGSCPEPYVTILDETDDWALLECKVKDVFPKPKVQWLDSDNNKVSAEETQVPENDGKFNIILKATVTKSDVYRCVSTQEEICHQLDQKIKVTLQDPAPEPTNVSGPNTRWIVGLVVGIAIGVVVAAALCFIWKYKDRIASWLRRNCPFLCSWLPPEGSQEETNTNSDEPEALRLEKSDKELINNEEETIVLSSDKTDGDRC